MSFSCSLCGKQIDPASPSTFHRIEAWERKGLGSSRRGGSDVVLRVATGEWAHPNCIERKKMGVPVAQESMSL